MKPRQPIIPTVFAASLAYAVVRYVVIKGIPAAHLPLFIVNKAVAMTALALLGLAFVQRRPESQRDLGRSALAAAALHTLLSLAVLSPSYFPDYYLSAGTQTGFTFQAGTSMLAGIIGIVAMAGLGWRDRASGMTETQKWGLSPIAVMTLVALHCVAAGWARWWQPADWPGGLPPITLLSFLYILGVVLIGARRGRAAD